MRRVLTIMLIFAFGLPIFASSRYDIETVLEKVEPDANTYAICEYSSNSPKEVKYLLLPTKISEGKYKVKVTKVDQNLYHVEGTNTYLKTKYCYEYSYSEEVFLIIKNNYKYSYGEIIFD